MPTILMGTSRLAPEIVFGRILPGLALIRLVELSTFAYLGIRLAHREDRTDVTALPYGISTPVMFVYLFGIMGPVYFASNDPSWFIRSAKMGHEGTPTDIKMVSVGVMVKR